jgi:hypothetical protein
MKNFKLASFILASAAATHHDFYNGIVSPTPSGISLMPCLADAFCETISLQIQHPPSTILFCCSGIGLEVLALATVYPKTAMIALEPNKKLAECCEINLESKAIVIEDDPANVAHTIDGIDVIYTDSKYNKLELLIQKSKAKTIIVRCPADCKIDTTRSVKICRVRNRKSALADTGFSLAFLTM